jgi:molybdopterin-containing oxidoreductase family iron-sulfur binding subunit
MAVDRRNFCKVAGIASLAIAGSRALPAKAQQLPEGSEAPAPLTASRWAMVVDLKACQREKGCEDCIAACHRTHNVPEMPDERHSVKWIWKESYEEAFPNQEHHYLPDDLAHNPLLVFCNHCDDPPCTRVCPTQATWKRESDGVVMMDWHRCIGCRYCIAACPYGSRSFNWQDPRPFLEEVKPEFPTRTRGVVEKCNFCEERLAKGLLPACVEACEGKCLVFGDLEDPESEVRRLLRARHAIRRKPSLGTEPEVYYLV